MMKFGGWASSRSKVDSQLYSAGKQTINGRALLRQLGKYAGRCVLLAASLTCIAFPSHAANPELIPVANHTNFSDEALGKYLAENLNQNLKDEIAKRNLAVFALSATFSGQRACFASVGLTEVAPSNRNARRPASEFNKFLQQPEKDWDTKAQCGSETLVDAIAYMNSASMEDVLGIIERTNSDGGTRHNKPLEKETVTLNAAGIDDKKALFAAIHDHGLSVAFDHRYVMTAINAFATQFKDGRYMCVAFAGLTGTSPDGRNNRWPAVTRGYVRFQTDGTLERCKQIVAEQAIHGLLELPWTADGLLKSFELTREDGFPLPDAAKVAKKKAALDRSKTASKPSRPPLSTPPFNGETQNSCRPNGPTIQCRSQCTNGDCVVSYNNGCSLRVQVRPTFDPFTNQWKYPAPSC